VERETERGGPTNANNYPVSASKVLPKGAMLMVLHQGVPEKEESTSRSSGRKSAVGERMVFACFCLSAMFIAKFEKHGLFVCRVLSFAVATDTVDQ